MSQTTRHLRSLSVPQAPRVPALTMAPVLSLVTLSLFAACEVSIRVGGKGIPGGPDAAAPDGEPGGYDRGTGGWQGVGSGTGGGGSSLGTGGVGTGGISGTPTGGTGAQQLPEQYCETTLDAQVAAVCASAQGTSQIRQETCSHYTVVVTRYPATPAPGKGCFYDTATKALVAYENCGDILPCVHAGPPLDDGCTIGFASGDNPCAP